MKRKFIVSTCIILFFFLSAYRTYASVLYLFPGKGSIPIGTTTSVQIRLSTQGESVNGVTAILSYPSDKLTVDWIYTGSSAFSIGADQTYGGGTIKVSRANINGITGDMNVATIGFRGKVLGATGTVSFSAGSAVPRETDSSDALNLGGSRGGIYTIISAPTAPPKKNPVISHVDASNIGTNSATILWQTDVPSDSAVEYGFDAGRYFITSFDPTLVTYHSIVIQSDALIPGVIFHFKVISKDKLQNLSSSSDMQFQLAGYTLTLRVTDENKNPLPHVQVSLYSQPAQGVTNTNGEVVFKNISPGNHVILVKKGDIEKTQVINVASDGKDRNTFSITVNTTPFLLQLVHLGPITIPVALGIDAIGLLIILVLIALLLLRRKRKSSATGISNKTQIIRPGF